MIIVYAMIAFACDGKEVVEGGVDDGQALACGLGCRGYVLKLG